MLFFHFVQEYPLSEEELLALRMDEVRLCLYTSLIFGHALLKIVQNLLLQCFDDAVITFIRQEKTVNNFEQCMSECRAGIAQPLLL